MLNLTRKAYNMRRYLMRRYPLAMFMLAAFSCSRLSALPQSPTARGSAFKSATTVQGANGFGKATEGVRLKLELTDNIIAAWNPCALTITVKNVSDRTLQFVRTSPYYLYVLKITDPSGKRCRIHDDSRVFFMYATVDLPQGQSLLDTYSTRYMYDFEAPGTYTISAIRTVWRLDGKGPAWVESNPVTIRVLRLLPGSTHQSFEAYEAQDRRAKRLADAAWLENKRVPVGLAPELSVDALRKWNVYGAWYQGEFGNLDYLQGR